MDEDYLHRFGGIGRLYGTAALKRYANAHVAIVGIGGVGSWAAEALARSGVGEITMIDLDEICLTNINRQLHAMDGAIGQLKIEAMAERIRKINPNCKLHLHPAFFSKRNDDEFLSAGFNALIDAIDASLPKSHLLAECRKRAIPVVTCGGAGGRQDPTQIKVADLSRTEGCTLLKQVRIDLRNHYGFPNARPKQKKKKFYIEAIYSTEIPHFPTCDGDISTEKPKDSNLRLTCESGFGTSTPITATFGLFAAARILKILETEESP